MDFKTALNPESLMQRVKVQLANLSPDALAEFEKLAEQAWQMRQGDEYAIVMFGLWNGSVRVKDVTPTSFTFITLKGHPGARRSALRPAPAKRCQ